MELNDRKIKILEAIITDYISTGDPIGSRTIAKKYDLGVSSATIRNEMSDLEELGLIEQPHASAGRVPSDKGYRLYVDKFMIQMELSDEDKTFLQNIVATNINQIDFLMEETAKALSLLTNYATVVSKPQVEKDKIKHISVMPFDEKSSLVTLVTENKIVKNFQVPINKILSNQDIFLINQEIASILEKLENHDLNNLENLENLEDLKDLKDLKNLNGLEDNNLENLNIISSNQNVNHILKYSVNALKENNDMKIFTSGINNILEFKEFNNIDKARSLFNSLEEKDMLVNILENNITEQLCNNNNNNNNIQILIGDEHHIKAIKECSIVKTEYKIAGAKGTIGIIAPTRMDYAKTVSILNNIIENINDIISETKLN